MKLTKLAQTIGLTLTTSLMLIGCGGSGSSSSSSPSHSEDYYEGINYKIVDRGDVIVGNGMTLQTSTQVTSIEAENGTVETQSTQTQSEDSKTWIYTLDQTKLEARKIIFPLTEKLTFNYDDGTQKEETLKVDSKDEFFKYQWHLYNVGDNKLNFTKPLKKGIDLNFIGAWNTEIDPKTHKKATGKGVVVAVWDSEVDFEHSDLSARKFNDIEDPENLINQPIKNNTNRHGTAVAGIIGATGNNGGVRGEAFEAQIYSYNLDNENYDKLLNDHTNVINASFGAVFYAESESKNKLFFDNLYKSNIPVIQAQGNDYKDAPDYDFFKTHFDRDYFTDLDCDSDLDCQFMQNDDTGRNQGVIHVSAINALGKKSSYSSTGSNVWVAGFGGEYGLDWYDGDHYAITSTLSHFKCSDYTQIKTLDYDYNEEYQKYNLFRSNIEKTCLYTSSMNGTSAAAPSISGIVALMKEANTNLTVPQIKYILAKSAHNDSDWPTLSYDSTSIYFGDKLLEVEHGWLEVEQGLKFSNWYGFGVPDAKKALDLTLTCSNDEFCEKRTKLPKVFVSSNKVLCTQKQENEITSGYVTTCDLSTLVESDETFKTTDKEVTTNIELENVSVDIKGISFISEKYGECAWDDQHIDEVYKKVKNKQESSTLSEVEKQISLTSSEVEELTNMYKAYSKTQISLTYNGMERVIKPYKSYWINILLDPEDSTKELNVLTNAFYLKKINPNEKWTLKVYSTCQINTESLAKYLKLAIHGYVD